MSEPFPLLSGIAEPTDLHRLSDPQLVELAREVRHAILSKVSSTGGHLSSNLGTVELTVALYAAFNIPPDIAVWDTGHQAYPHKLLTGRLDRFETLRKHGGISGFLRREEHELDSFGAGHAGTAISAALGFAAARDRRGTTEKVIAITGDAAICSGMSWEALNHAGELGTDLLVVLNDNRMSIAPNVGALTKYFTRLRSRPHLQSLAARAKRAVERLPQPMTRVAAGLRHGLTHYFAPEETGTIFEEIGFEYIGPIDGHDLVTMLEVFRNVRELRGPLFVHAMTVKGKGYEVAELDSRKWHGVVPFDIEAQEMKKAMGPVTFTQTFGDAALQAAEEDPTVVAITAAMPDGTGLTGFAEKFPDRYYDVGIAEQHAVTFAAGLAAGGIKPLCAIYSTFLQRGYDQVLHDVAIQGLPVRFFLDRAGLVGDDGPTHHGAFDLSYLTAMPNMTVAAPRDTTELFEMVKFAVGFDSGPIAVRYPRGAGDDRLPESRSPVSLGKAEILSKGDDITLAAIGTGVSIAWQAREQLEKLGRRVSVVNLRFAKPIDYETVVDLVRSSGRLIVIEENVIAGGVGQQIVVELHRRGLDFQHALVGLPDKFVEHGAQPIIREQEGYSLERVLEEAAAMGLVSSAKLA
ncbi:MAG: 1-deoxy-D-xylulose-5-phosphate synthase [Fimbriimonadaceae bacterium]|nr:1-deoxy-D-xylulose-5-phosphate synthase [Fimbriimonadaceae bacterium]